MESNTNLPDHTWNSASRLLKDGLLSIIMPAFNLGPSIAGNILSVHNLFSGKFHFEIVVVDDGSSDNTRSEIEKISASCPGVRTVFLSRNSGKGAALKKGFDASKGSYVLFLDADLDIPPDQAAAFFDAIERENVDMVIGSKHHPDSFIDSYPWHRRLVSVIYYWLIKFLVNLPIRDTQTGMKLFKRQVLEAAMPRMLVKQFAFDIELLAIAHEKGYRFAESPVTLNIKGSWPLVSASSSKQVLIDTLAVFYRLRILKFYQSMPDAKMPDPLPFFSIVIAYPSATSYLEECMDGIASQSYRQYEIILLPDEPSGRIWPANVKEIPTGHLRPAEKRNIGVNNATGDLIAFIDDDAFPVENWLKYAAAWFTDKTIAAVGGPASTPPGDSYLAHLGGIVYANRLVSGPYRYRYEPGIVRDVEDYPSCNLIVRASVMKQLNGFRTDFWPGEDTYLCLDIVKKLQLRIVYDPRIAVHHHRRKLFLPHLRQIGRYAMHRGYFAMKFPETSRKLSYMFPSLFVAGIIAGAIVSAFFEPLLPLYLIALAFYASVTLLSSFKLNPFSWLLVWLGVMLTHIVYGIRFVIGTLTSKLPGEKQRFDHPSEK